MTDNADGPAASDYAAEHFRPVSSWVAWTAFSGVVLTLVGLFHLFQGVVALVNEDYFQSLSSDLVVDVSYTTWGWAQIIGGIVVLVAGLCVFGGQVWARVVGVLVAVASSVVSLGFMSAHPVWCAIMIAMNVVVIMALTVHGSEIST